jgi:type I restriction enzyme S subunit
MYASNQMIKFSEIARIRNGYAFKSKDYAAKGVGLVRQSNLTGNLVDMDDAKYLPFEFLTKYQQFIVNKGDVLIGLSGSIGEPSIYGEDAPALQNQRTGLIIPVDDDPSTMFYVRYLLLFLTNELMGSSKGAGIQNLSAQDIENLPIPFHNQKERTLIVKNLDEYFSKIDEGISSLEVTERQLELYRQSVLKDAFEGKLTADWRAANPDLVEPPDKLLALIEAERKSAHQAELDAWEDAVNQWEVKGKDGKKPSKPKAPHALPTITDELSLFEGKIPEDWFLGTVGHLTNGVEYGTSSKSKKTGSYPVFRMGNLEFGELTWDDLVFTNDEAEFKKYELNSGDVLFNRTNSPALVGKSAIFRGEQPSLFAGYLIRVNQIDTVCLSEFLNYFLNSSKAKQYGNLVKTDGVNQSNINGKKLLSYPIPICTIAEQKEIVLSIQKQCDAIKQSQRMLQKMSQQSSALKQSILKQAFSGHELLEDAS